MPDVNALYPQPPQQQPQQNSLLSNPLNAIAAIMHATQLQKARQELVAKQAIGRAYQNNMNEDGTINLPGAQKQILTDPEAAFSAPQATSDILGQQGQIIANGTAQFQQQGSQNKFVMDALGTLANKPDVSANDLDNLAVTIARNTNIPSNIITGWRSGIPSDPKGIRAALTTIGNMAQGYAAGVQPGPAAISGSGAPVVGTSGQFNYGAAGVGAGPYAPPGGGTPGSAAPGPALPGSAAAAPGGVQTGLAPGQAESAKVMQADLVRAGTFPQEIYPWQQALQKMQEMQGQGETFGPGSKGRQELESFVYALSPSVAKLAGVDPEKISKYAEVEKYLTQGLGQRASSFGPHTDAGLATAASGTPNVHITDLAGVPLVKATIGLRRMEQAQILDNARLGGPNYTQNTAQWATKQDPRAYMIDMMSPEQVQSLQKSLKGAARTQFNASLQAAIRSGVVKPPGQ